MQYEAPRSAPWGSHFPALSVDLPRHATISHHYSGTGRFTCKVCVVGTVVKYNGQAVGLSIAVFSTVQKRRAGPLALFHAQTPVAGEGFEPPTKGL